MSESEPMSRLPLVAAEQCTAHSKGTGQRCGRRTRGGGVCRYHGGNSPRTAARREARIATAEAAALFSDRYEPRPWWEALPAAATTADQLMRALADRVELSGELRAADLDALAQMADRVAKLAKLVQDAGLDERMAQMSERQGAQAAQVFRAVFADPQLALSPAQAAVAPSIAARYLRELGSGERPALRVGSTR